MHIWFLSHLEDSPSCRLLQSAATARGHEHELVNPASLRLGFNGCELGIFRGQQNLKTMLPDVVYTRLGSAAPLESRHLVRQLESLGVNCINSSKGLENCRDKVRAYRELAQAKLPLLKSVFLSSIDPLGAIPESLGGAPWIVKLPVGTKGQSVVLADSAKSLRSIVGAFQSLGQSVLIQEFVAEAEASDLRVIVVGGKAIAAMRRTAAKGEFRANLHQGGRAEKVALTTELVDLSVQAAETLGLGVAGVDLLKTKTGYAILEVNGSPGLSGIQAVHDFSLAEKVIQHLETCG